MGGAPDAAGPPAGGQSSGGGAEGELRQRRVEMGADGAPAVMPPFPKAANQRRRAPAGHSRGGSGRGRAHAPALVAAGGAPCAGALLLEQLRGGPNKAEFPSSSLRRSDSSRAECSFTAAEELGARDSSFAGPEAAPLRRQRPDPAQGAVAPLVVRPPVLPATSSQTRTGSHHGAMGIRFLGSGNNVPVPAVPPRAHPHPHRLCSCYDMVRFTSSNIQEHSKEIN